MRTLLTCLLVLATPAFAQDVPPEREPPYQHGPRRPGGPGGGGGGGGRLFISPMGEPFRSEKGGTEPQNLWFDQADTNHDKVLTRAEFQADAMRFFAVLDRGHDGEIDPDDIEHYESVIAPEIRVQSGGYEAPPSDDGGSSSSAPVYPDRQGAARYGYFSFPEPVMSADTNFNRGVSVQEFAHAADSRFDSLDANHDGKIDRDELPRIAPPRAENGFGGRGGGHRGGRGGGHRGSGMGGSGRGGSGTGGGGMGGTSIPPDD